ncbi:hypothetical protein ENBRE01_0632 [Enteropsectra breve]|nr:hypothetical protein ENBRE01_0632 [Enteropsectra breve]
MEHLREFRRNFFNNEAFIYWLLDYSAAIKMDFVESLNFLRLPVATCKKLLNTEPKVISSEYFKLCLRLYVSCMDTATELNMCLLDLLEFIKYGKLYGRSLRMDFLTEIGGRLDNSVISKHLLSTIFSSVHPKNICNFKVVYEILYEIYFALGPSKKEFLSYFCASIFEKECNGLNYANYSRVHGCKLPPGSVIVREFYREFSESCRKGEYVNLSAIIKSSAACIVHYLYSVDKTDMHFLRLWLKKCAKNKLESQLEKKMLGQKEYPFQLAVPTIAKLSNSNDEEIQKSLKFLMMEAFLIPLFYYINTIYNRNVSKEIFIHCYALNQICKNRPLIDIWLAYLGGQNKLHSVKKLLTAADENKSWDFLEFIFVNYKDDPSLFFSADLSKKTTDFLGGILKRRVWSSHLLSSKNCYHYLLSKKFSKKYEHDDVALCYLKEIPKLFTKIPSENLTAMFNQTFSKGRIWNTGYFVLGLKDSAMPLNLTQEDVEKWCAATRIECSLGMLHKSSEVRLSNRFFAVYFGHILRYLDNRFDEKDRLEAKLSSVYFLIKISLVHADNDLIKEMFDKLLHGTQPKYFTGILLLCLYKNPKLKYNLLDWIAFKVASRKRKRDLPREDTARALTAYREKLALATFKCSPGILMYRVIETNFIPIYQEFTSFHSLYKSLISRGHDCLLDIKSNNLVMYKKILSETVIVPPEIIDTLLSEDIK